MSLRILSIWLFAGLLASAPAIALDPTRSLVQMFHRAYTRDDGLSGAVHGIAQTPDGYLWVGTDDGLYRFDGVRFEHVADKRFLSRGILALKLTGSGDMWISYAHGGLSRLRAGVVTNYSTTAEGAEITAQGIVEVPNGGGLWGVGGYGPYRFDGRNWHVMSGPWVPAAQGGGLRSTEPGRDGTLWAKNGDGVYYCRPGCVRFVPARGYAGGPMGFTHDREGRVWTSDSRAPGHMYAMPNLSRVSDSAIPGPAYGGQISPRIRFKVFLDRDGTLWSQNIPHGLLRVRSMLVGRSDPAQAEGYSASDGLSSDIVTTFFEDREGSVWVGTFGGLDSFRPANVVLERQMPTKVGLHGYNAGGATDALFFYANKSEDTSSAEGLSRGPLYRVDADSSVQLVLPEMDWPYSMAPAADGGLWVGLLHGLYKLKNGSLADETLPANLQGAAVREIAEPATGVLWLLTIGHGLWHRVNGVWSHVHARADTEARQWGNMAVDSHGIPWLVDDRTIARYVNGSLLEVPTNAGPSIGAVNTMAPDAHGILFGGDSGIARFDGRGFHTLRSERVPALAIVSGIVETGGKTWIASQAGVLRFDTDALEHAIMQSNAPPPHYELFDRQDGLPDSIQLGPYSASNGSAFLGPHGRIWFLTNGGIAWIDPHHIYRNAVAPAVAIRALTFDGRTYTSPRGLNLPAGVSNLEIDYAALSFAEPSKLQFRYKLEGVDSDWVDPGQRRQAFYTRLGPGNYSFHVIASNNDGVWNRTGASLAFTIPPTFVQSIWFKVLVVLTLVALAWLAYTLRLKQETARLQSRFNVRIAERERIARELHDTLLQGSQWLLLRFQAIAERVQGDELRKEIKDTLDRADAVLAEGRARVRELRTSSPPGDFAQSLAGVASTIIGGDTPRFHLAVEGEQRALYAMVSEEILRIFEEAVRNVLKHANAKNIDAFLIYGARELRLSVRDNGVGMDQSQLTGSDGHFGLVGMRERAERIGAHLQIVSREGGGTAVVMYASARVAYKGRRIWPLWSRSLDLSENIA